MQLISIYDTEFHSKKGGIIDFEFLFDNIRNGAYKDKVQEIRLAKQNFKLEDERLGDLLRQEKHKDEKWEKAWKKLVDLKGKIHRVTISGAFSDEGRLIENLKKHSGYIDLDIDDLQPEEIPILKAKFQQDKYCYATFVTCGGDGLSFIARIDGNRHTDAWEGLAEYFYTTYGVKLDPVHKSVANTRNVSYDPDLFLNEGASLFKDYLKKKKPKPVQRFIYAKNDFEDIINEIAFRKLDFCDTYENYRNIGFALGNKFGLDGLDYFLTICQYNDKYDQRKVTKDYKWFCKNPEKGITISTFYGRCKDFNIDVYSKKTQLIASIASVALKTGKSQEDTVKNLYAHENIPIEDSTDIVRQVYELKLDIRTDDSVIIEIKNWLKHNYNLRLNIITQHVENNGIQLDDRDYNSIIVQAKIAFGSEANSKLMMEILHSDFIESYNPIQDFFKENKQHIPLFLPGEIPDVVLRLWDTFETDNKEYLIKYGTKWLVSIIAAAHYTRSPLMLILVGSQDVGKSEFFERLLPDELKRYFGNPDLGSGKDFYIALGQKLIVLDDEVSGKSKKEDLLMNRLLTTPFFTLRKPYGMTNVDIKRLAVLCGTSNPMQILTDPSGNRRYIPVKVLSRNFKAFDEIDKTELFMALYQMWKDGFVWKVSGADIKELNACTKDFEFHTTEHELIQKYFDKGGEELTATDIKVFLENKTNQKLNINRIGSEMQKLGFERKSVNNGSSKVYLVKPIDPDRPKGPF